MHVRREGGRVAQCWCRVVWGISLLYIDGLGDGWSVCKWLLPDREVIG